MASKKNLKHWGLFYDYEEDGTVQEACILAATSTDAEYAFEADITTPDDGSYIKEVPQNKCPLCKSKKLKK